MTGVLGAAFGWWAATTAVGLAAAPIARALMPTLPDRGWSVARPLGLVLVGYAWWLLVTAGVLPNSRLGVVVALVVVAAGGVALVAGDLAAWRRELWQRRRLIAGLEALYAVALVGWALYKAFTPEVTESGGEKMMEMAFLSAIVKSPGFPPNDPWLSGHGISYYYFGYLIAAMLVQLTGLSRFVAFNLVVPMTLAMTLVAAFGLGWTLATMTPGTSRRLRLTAGALTAGALALAGNLAGFLELAYMRGWLPARLFDHMNIRNLTVAADACGEPGSGFGAGGWFPSRFMWWWRTSRVIRDGCKDVIQEYPFFSFLLADVHPHVMALPYALLVVALALAVWRGAVTQWRGARFVSPVWLLLPLCVGALGFLNTWDLPTYGLVVGASFVVWRWRRGRPLGEIAAFGAWLLGLGIVLYLPFYLAFRSQAAGIGLARHASRLDHWAVHFLPLVFLAATVVVVALRRLGRPRALAVGAWTAGIAVFAVGLRWAAWAVARRFVPPDGEVGWTVYTPVVVVALAAAALLAALIEAGVWGAGEGSGGDGDRAAGGDGADGAPVPGAAGFALLCIAVGAAMAAVPEFIYLKDVFNDRMNTVFKFFFQAWVLLSIGGGYALTAVLAGHAPRPTPLTDDDRRHGRRWRARRAFVAAVRDAGAARATWCACLAVVALMVLYTPVAAVYNRTDGLRWVVRSSGGWRAWSATLHLDGLRHWERDNPDDLAAARWLDAHAVGTPVILEAAGGGYDRAGRIAMITGFPTVLGADNHESQWQGTRVEIDPRLGDVEAFYTRQSAAEMQATVERYGVRHVIVGARERERYRTLAPDLDTKLATFMTPVYRSGQTTVWSLSDAAAR